MAENYLRYSKAIGQNPCSDFNRFFVYRFFKKYSISLSIGNGRNKKVTHAFRHLVSKSMKDAGMSLEDNQQMLGHVNINSTKYYHGTETKGK